MSALGRSLALCGHQDCPSWTPHNSVLDEDRDVVLYDACDGSRHLFRDGHDDGLILAHNGDGWTLTRERYVLTDDSAHLVPDAEPICDIGQDRAEFVARHRPSSRVIARHNGTAYGLLAKAARFYLRVPGA